MVTRWTAGPNWAVSVRPDIWPAGWDAHIKSAGRGLPPGTLATWGWGAKPTMVPVPGGDVPGAAEALILADQVVQALHPGALAKRWRVVTW